MNDQDFQRQMLARLVDLQSRQTQLAIEQAKTMRALCARPKSERKGPQPEGGAMRLVKRSASAA